MNSQIGLEVEQSGLRSGLRLEFEHTSGRLLLQLLQSYRYLNSALILHYLEQVPHRDMPPSLLPTGAATTATALTVKRPRVNEVSCYDSQPLFHILGLVVRQIILIFM